MSDFPSHLPRKLDIERILDETLVVEVEHHGALASTNDRAKQAVLQTAIALPLLVVADCQTAGRGRGSNRWWTGEGSLAFSLLTATHNWSVQQTGLALTALAAGAALVGAIAPRLPGRRVGLHWPNDLYVEERKLAGILVEVPGEGRLVVGVGVNTNSHLRDAPAELQGRVGTLADLSGTTHDHTELLIDWLRRWEHWIDCLPHRPERIAEEADRVCLQHGRLLRLRQGRRIHEGCCRGIAADGALLLESQQGLRRFYSGTLDCL